jgi:hypothetical protein
MNAVINGIQQPYTYNQWRFAWLILHLSLFYMFSMIIFMIVQYLGIQTNYNNKVIGKYYLVT